MQIKVKPVGIMQKFFSDKKMTFSLRKNATLADLYDQIGRTLGDELPRSIWNHEKNRFRGPITVISCQTVLKNESTLLKDNQLIELKRFLVGG